jgi:hypothetical protein
LSARSERATLEARVSGGREDFVGLPYDNPPGGRKLCLNTKLASAELVLTPGDGAPVRLRAQHRAAFEILTDRDDHGVPVLDV